MTLHGQALQFLAGGGTIAMLARILLILLATWMVAKVFDRVLERRFRSASRRMDMGKTSYSIVKRLMNVGIYILGLGVAVYTVPQLRQLSFALFASAGFIGIVIGFAAQAALSNIIAGIFIAVFQPFRVDDRIETQTHYGTVEDITLRQTVINTPSNERVIVPNAKILDDYIINYSIGDEKSRYSVKIGIAYREDIDLAREIMLEEAEDHDTVIDGESQVIVSELADSAVVLELRIWAATRPDVWQAGQDLRESIKKRFDAEGITIPFPQRTVSYLEDGK